MGIRNGEDNWLETGQRDEDGDEEKDGDNDEFDLAEQATVHPPCYSHLGDISKPQPDSSAVSIRMAGPNPIDQISDSCISTVRANHTTIAKDCS
jgi:hypothetical protein